MCVCGVDSDWQNAAVETLLASREPSGGWGDQRGARPRAEPTALAALSVIASTNRRESTSSQAVARRAAELLAGWQQPDGALGISAAITSATWPTPLALLLWAALGEFQTERRKAAAWLLEQKGKTTAPVHDGSVGHDPSIAGWPWVGGTHSWLEPTAMAILALRQEGFASHPRLSEGVRMIQDRALAGGGWNYGNPVVLGRSLRPQIEPTGLALLALAGYAGNSRRIEPAARFLEATLPGVRSARSLSWGLLGLKAWRRTPPASDRWLAEAASRCLSRPDSAPRLALLLLASGDRSLRCLGLVDPAGDQNSPEP